LALWLIYIAALAFAMIVAALYILPDSSRPKDTPPSTFEVLRAETVGEALWRGGSCCIPTFIMTGLALAIFSACSANSTTDPSFSEVVHGLSWDQTSGFLSDVLRGMSYIGVLFGSLFFFVALVMKWRGENASGCWLFASIFAAIVVMTTVGVGLNPFLNGL